MAEESFEEVPIKPLRLEAHQEKKSEKYLECLFCDFTIELIQVPDYSGYQRHLIVEHKFVIGAFKIIQNIPQYVYFYLINKILDIKLFLAFDKHFFSLRQTAYQMYIADE